MAVVQDKIGPIAEHRGRRVSRWAIVLAVFLTAGPAFVASVFHSAVGDFDVLYRGFGVDLPSLTRFVVSHPLLINLLLRVCAAAQVLSLAVLVVNRTVAARRLFLSVGIVSLVVTLVVVAALYAPIIAMGNVV